MLIKEYMLTPREVQYLIDMPCESEEAKHFSSKLRVNWEKKKNLDKWHGRWHPLVWFCQFERIMEVDEMMAAIRRFGDEETFEMLKIV